MPGILPGRLCPCGTCPSIELITTAAKDPTAGTSPIVLQASTHRGLILVFITHDHPNYLELVPLATNVAITEFPLEADIATGLLPHL